MKRSATLRRLTEQQERLPDDQLCIRLRAGDEGAFRALVLRHHAPMVRFALSFVKTKATAEEVVQDTWLAVLNGIDTFEQRSSVTTWLYAILANKARTRGLRDSRTIPFSELAATDDNDPAVDPGRFDSSGMWIDPPRVWDDMSPERIVAGKELWSHVADVLDGLPPTQRAVITLQDVEGLDGETICTLLQLTDANRRVLLHRARAKVRKVLESLLAR